MRVVSVVAEPQSVESEWLAVGLFEGRTNTRAFAEDSELGVLIERLVASGEFTGKVGQTAALFPGGASGPNVLAFGLGKPESFDAGSAYRAGVAVGKRLAAKPRKTVAVVLPESSDPQTTHPTLTEGLVVGTQGPGLHKAEASRHEFEELKLIEPPSGPFDSTALKQLIERSAILGKAVNQARRLVNRPPSEKSPEALAASIAESAREAGVSVEVWNRDRIEAERFGGLLGVSTGSANPPAFVTLEYQGAGESPYLAFVGKGVTFDSGGLSLKPSASMEDMKADMTGAAVVASAIQAAAELKLPVNLRGYLPMSENMTGGRAMKLGDVLTMRNGTTVEVMNTDAEGRLILADALAFAAEQKPAQIVNLATLTGACVVALGQKVAGLFSNDDALAEAMQAACQRTGERAWRLPLDEDFAEQLKSSVADCKNVGSRWGGAITAAKFLQKFIDDLPWLHLDIAGPSWADSENATSDEGGTGCFVRALVALAESQAV